jgi:hypothetical protein
VFSLTEVGILMPQLAVTDDVEIFYSDHDSGPRGVDAARLDL